MAHTLSAKKRIRQNLKHRLRNRAQAGAAKSQIKKFLDLAKTSTDMDMMEKELRLTHKKIDRLAVKGIIHKNRAARQKSRMSLQFDAAKNKA